MADALIFVAAVAGGSRSLMRLDSPQHQFRTTFYACVIFTLGRYCRPLASPPPQLSFRL